jgi:hypothetical protein
MRRFRKESAITAQPVQVLDGVFHCRVVSEAGTSPAMFSLTTMPASKQRTNSQPPSAPPTSQCARANSLAELVSTAKARHRLASNSSPREVAAMPSRPLQDGPARLLALVVEGRPRQALDAGLGRAVPEGRGGEIPHAGEQPQVARGGGAVAVEDGVAAAGGGLGVDAAERRGTHEPGEAFAAGHAGGTGAAAGMQQAADALTAGL